MLLTFLGHIWKERGYHLFKLTSLMEEQLCNCFARQELYLSKRAVRLSNVIAAQLLRGNNTDVMKRPPSEPTDVLGRQKTGVEQDLINTYQLHLHWPGYPETNATWIGSNIPVDERSIIYCHVEVSMSCKTALAKLGELRKSK
jgi:hypothetical protein